MRVLIVIAALAGALATPAPAAEPQIERFGVWGLAQVKDPMSDVVTVLAKVDAGDNDHLFLGCKPSEPGKRQVSIGHYPYLGRGNGRFTYRIDDLKAVDVDMQLFNKSGFIYGEDALAFFAKVPGAKRVRTQVFDQIMGMSAAEFDVTGVDKVLARLAALCDGPAKP